MSARKIIALVAAGCASPVAVAHHSGAMFDQEHSVTLAGTVKDFQWTNPHCWIQLTVGTGAGNEEWSVEMGAPLQLFQGGWRPGTLKSGDKIEVVVHPMRDGTKGGLFVSAKSLDGKPLGRAP